MKLLPLLLGLAAALPALRAQNIFAVTEGGASLAVRAVEDRRLLVLDHGKLRHSAGTQLALRRASIFNLGTLDVGAFKIEFSQINTLADEPDLHIYGRLKSDVALKHCFYVIRITGDLGTGLFYDGLPDLPAGVEQTYDRFFPYASQSHGMAHITAVYFFADGLQLLTSKDDPFFISRQHDKTRQVLQRQGTPH